MVDFSTPTGDFFDLIGSTRSCRRQLLIAPIRSKKSPVGDVWVLRNRPFLFALNDQQDFMKKPTQDLKMTHVDILLKLCVGAVVANSCL